ncbi:MAG: SDR family oxidoreductase [Nocardia sp.]|nr:SDR family oxidoreductase [Nocardia sp.]
MERQRELDMTGKVAIITGASRGIGKQTALALARRGVKVVLAARTVDKHAKLAGTLGETLAEIERLGSSGVAVQTDLASEDDLAKLVDAAVEQFGGVDLLINNAAATAGDFWSDRFLELSRKDWLYQFDVNLHAPFTLMQLVTPIMESRGGGRILNVTTGCGEVFRLPEEPAKMEKVGDFSLAVPGYYASKRALDRLANVLVPELTPKGIAVIGMMPGLVATEIVELRVKEEGLDDTQAVPMGVPARVLAYFAACEDPMEYSGRLFWAERELNDFGLELDDQPAPTA